MCVCWMGMRQGALPAGTYQSITACSVYTLKFSLNMLMDNQKRMRLLPLLFGIPLHMYAALKLAMVNGFEPPDRIIEMMYGAQPAGMSACVVYMLSKHHCL